MARVPFDPTAPAFRADPHATYRDVRERGPLVRLSWEGEDLWALARFAHGEVAIGDRTIRTAESVCLMLAAANRDPRRFEDPERLDTGRARNRHLAFGGGTRLCVGAPLARQLGALALGALIERFGDVALAKGYRPDWGESEVFRGLARFEV